jgi:geranylgeranyl diphosphate synthase type II
MSRILDIKTYLSDKRRIVENTLEKLMLQAVGPFADHIQAMRYSLFVGGKRIRPILCLAAGEAVAKSTVTENNLLPVACALECIHTYSLIHDDLPAMDDDDLRRGKPTNHTLFGEAGAILAGDSLLTWAFDLLSSPNATTLTPLQQLKIIQIIAKAAGPNGMVGGQALDIASEKSVFPFTTLQTIHKNKTGALITCSVHAGAIGAGAAHEQTEKLIAFGDSIGLAFQIVDDLLNVTATTEQLGKSAGTDANRGKATYPAFFGVEKTRKKAQEAVEKAIDALTGFNQNADPLRALAEYVYTRSH